MNSFWWAGPIAFRNLPTVDGRGITRSAVVTLRQGGAPAVIPLTGTHERVMVGKVGRIWDKNQDEIWAQLQLEKDTIRGRGDLYPCFDASREFTMDAEPFPWFTSLEIIGVTLMRDPGWPGLQRIILPM